MKNKIVRVLMIILPCFVKSGPVVLTTSAKNKDPKRKEMLLIIITLKVQEMLVLFLGP